MSKVRVNSSPDLLPSSSNHDGPDDSTLEGVAANVKLLLKLIQEQNDACTKDNNDVRKNQRVAGMISILDSVKARIQKSQSFGGQKREAELRRCNTELRRDNNLVLREKKPHESITDNKQMLRRELNESLAARKNLERMFSSLGKEKEVMAAELARKVHEINGMEEHLNDIKAQNQMLMSKVKTCVTLHRDDLGKEDYQGNVALHERNQELSDQLLKSLDRYRSLKRKLSEAQEEKACIQAKMVELAEEATLGLNHIQHFRQRNEQQEPEEVEEELSALEHMLRCFEMKLSKLSKCMKSVSFGL